MNNEIQIAKLAINTEVELGTITSNAAEVYAAAREIAKHYASLDYSEARVAVAKHDRAALNSAAKTVAAKRLEVTRQYNEPLELFLASMKAAEAELKAAAAQIDEVVKSAEEAEREKRMAWLHNLWLEMPASAHFDATLIIEKQWLNKTAKIADIQSAMEQKSRAIEADLQVIENIADNVQRSAARYCYNTTRDIGEAMRAANQVAQDQQRDNKIADMRATAQPTPSPEKPVPSTPANAATIEPATQKEKEPTYTIVLEVRGTRGQLEQLAVECQSIGVATKRLILN